MQDLYHQPYATKLSCIVRSAWCCVTLPILNYVRLDCIVLYGVILCDVVLSYVVLCYVNDVLLCFTVPGFVIL